MNNIIIKSNAFEAIKLTIICLAITFVGYCYKLDQQTMLIIFSISAVSAAITHKVAKGRDSDVFIGCVCIITATVFGGLLGNYSPLLVKILTLVYAGAACYFAKYRSTRAVFLTGTLMFLIYANFPFTTFAAIRYMLVGIIIAIIFTLYHHIHEKNSSHQPHAFARESAEKKTMIGLNVILSLAVGLLVSQYILFKFRIDKIYWLELIILLVVQNTYKKTLGRSLLRITINATSIFIASVIFSLIVENSFWLQLTLLAIMLFLIFVYSHSYIIKLLCTTLFILGMTHMLGEFHQYSTINRLYLTVIGYIIVMIINITMHLVRQLYLHEY